jgi:hypothetical protein
VERPVTKTRLTQPRSADRLVFVLLPITTSASVEASEHQQPPRFLIVVEIDDDIFAAFVPGSDARGPLGQRFRRVMPLVATARTVTSDVDKVRCSLPRSGSVVMVRQAKRDILVGQHFQDLRRVPTRIPEFKAVPPSVRQHLEEVIKPTSIRLEIRR